MTPRFLGDLKKMFVIVKNVRTDDIALGVCAKEEQGTTDRSPGTPA